MANCPACGLRCVLDVCSDYAECPDHGKISGLQLLAVKGMAPWEALLEIRAGQLHDIARRVFDRAKWAILNGKEEWRYPYA